MTTKTEKVNKTQLIRDQLKSMKPSERNPKAIVEALKKKGCTVSPTFVSVVKSKMKQKRRVAGKSKRSNAAIKARATTKNWKGWGDFLKNGKDFSNLMLAKNFLAAAGDIDQAKRVLDVVNKLVS
jgi:hypothetical protein